MYHVNSVDSTYRKCCGVRVEDVQTEFLQSLFKHDVHHGVLLTVLRVQVVDLKYDTTILAWTWTACSSKKTGKSVKTSINNENSTSKLKTALCSSGDFRCWSTCECRTILFTHMYEENKSGHVCLYLLHEEVVHAPVVVGAGEDLQRVVLPLSRFQSHVADLNAAPSLHLGRRLLVLLQVSEPPIQHRVRTAGRRHVLLTCCERGFQSVTLQGEWYQIKTKDFMQVSQINSRLSKILKKKDPTWESYVFAFGWRTVSQQWPSVSIVSIQGISPTDQLFSGRLLIPILCLAPETHLTDPAHN